jgi:hypothetical protein
MPDSYRIFYAKIYEYVQELFLLKAVSEGLNTEYHL